jgi:hypothetical protein
MVRHCTDVRVGVCTWMDCMAAAALVILATCTPEKVRAIGAYGSRQMELRNIGCLGGYSGGCLGGYSGIILW